VVRLYEDFFPSVDVETVLLFVEGKGGSTDSINYRVYETICDLFEDKCVVDVSIAVDDVVTNKKPFTSSLMPERQSELLDAIRGRGLLESVFGYCKHRIGYVCGDKRFFHPDEATRAAYGLSDVNFRPTILNSKEINGGTGIGICVFEGDCSSKLYYPIRIGDGDEAYIRAGESCGVSRKYKCMKRKPWYVTPNVETPDVILSVFGDVPKLVLNKGAYAVSNSLLCGSLRHGVDPMNYICRWYNSLTLLSIELNVHSLGGGSLVLIPGEADSLELVKPLPEDAVGYVFRQLDDVMKGGKTQEVYCRGDELVLKEIMGLSDEDVSSIREALASLRRWRSTNHRRLLLNSPL
jgi:hypothetical protein